MVDGKNNQHDVRIVVREWTKSVEILLSSGIPESEFHELVVELHLSHQVLKDRWDVILPGEKGGREGKEVSSD